MECQQLIFRQRAINIGTIPGGTSSVITFDVLIGDTLPTPNLMPNTATISFSEALPVDINTVRTLVFSGSRGASFI